MGNPFASTINKTLEHDVQEICAFFALDGSSNVIGQMPTNAPPGTGPYSLCKGFGKALGIAGAVVTQPHTGAGTYLFTLDEPWICLVNAGVTLIDQGAVAAVNSFVDANVRANNNGTGVMANGVMPGTNSAIANLGVRVLFRSAGAGALTNPVASTGFWLYLQLKRTGIP